MLNKNVEVDLISKCFPDIGASWHGDNVMGRVFAHGIDFQIYTREQEIHSQFPIFPDVNWAHTNRNVRCGFYDNYANAQDLYGLLCFIKSYERRSCTYQWKRSASVWGIPYDPNFRVVDQENGKPSKILLYKDQESVFTWNYRSNLEANKLWVENAIRLLFSQKITTVYLTHTQR